MIRSHQEAQKKLSNSFTATSSSSSNTNDNKLNKLGGPGKALRQSDFSRQSTKSQETSKLNTSNNSDNNVTSRSTAANQTSSSSSASTTIARSDLNASLGALSVNNNEKKANDNGTSRTAVFSYVTTRDSDEDESKLEKFRSILAKNPINLDDLQKASWKGIPKTFRPICWKLLSDYLPLKCELQEKTIEQKRQAYWESVSEHYSSIYIDSHHEMLRQVRFCCCSISRIIFPSETKSFK